MLEISRTVRFCLDGEDHAAAPPRHNTFSAWPPMRGLGRFYELHVRCRGEADPTTGYFININQIDRAVRDHVLPYLQGVVHADPKGFDVALGTVLSRSIDLLQPALGDTVAFVQLHLTPFYNLTMRSDQRESVVIRQQFEFAAAHRLHVAELSDQENRAVFGKCNNPAGHGHNYRVDVAVRVPIDARGRVMPIDRIDAWVDRHVIEVLDHKNLNVDVEQFRTLNPSVENIAKVIYQMLAEHVGDLDDRASLEEVSVWETSKTVCTYRGPGSRARTAAGGR